MRYLPSIAVEEKEYIIILKSKAIHGGNWHDFILDTIRFYNENKMKGGDKKNV